MQDNQSVSLKTRKVHKTLDRRSIGPSDHCVSSRNYNIKGLQLFILLLGLVYGEL